MSYNLHTSVPSGAVSRGYNYESEEEALENFGRVRSQLVNMGFVGELILLDGVQREILRETFYAA